MSKFYDDDFGAAPTIFDIVRSLARPVSEFADHVDNSFKGDDTESGESFRADLCDLCDHYELKAELPGVRKEDIEMSFDDGVLSVKAPHNTGCCCQQGSEGGCKADAESGDDGAQAADSQKADGTGAGPKFIIHERTSGTYERSFSIPDADAENITASFENGVLSVSLSKEQPKKGKVISIN